VPFPGGAEGI